MTNLSGANLNNGAAVSPQGEGMDSPSTFPKYPDYKESGADWCGVVPAEWRVLKLKRVARLQSGEFITSETIEEEAQYPVYGGNGLRGYTTAHTHEGEYALIGRQGALCGNINYACGKFWASEHAVVVYPERGAVTRWLGELLRSMNLGQYSVSAAQPGLSVERIADLFIPVPSHTEQTQIAGFLDHETARIDALIEEQQRLIELLKEKRQAVISRAATKGLDPTVPMKDSGVEWLGEVPAHWKVIKLGLLASDRCDGPFGSALKSEHYTDEGVRVIRLQNIKSGWFNDADSAFIDADYYRENIGKSDVISGDVLIAGLGDDNNPVGRACVAPENIAPAMVKADCFRFRLMPDVAVSEFIALQLTAGATADAGILSTGSTRARIPLSSMSTRLIALPPVTEQQAVVSFIQRLNESIDSLFSEAQSGIALLQERRSALISAAVTGKIDVRGWQPPASTQAPEPAVAEAH